MAMFSKRMCLHLWTEPKLPKRVCYSLYYMRKRCYSTIYDTYEDEMDDRDKSFLHQFEDQHYLLPNAGHRVAVLQPYVKWGRRKNRLTPPQLRLDEACTLAESLPGWKVTRKILQAVDNMDKRQVFGPGVLRSLTDDVIAARDDEKDITAVFISHNMLRVDQLDALQKRWNLPIYDRYTLVLQIFKQRARTREAKLQVSLAELYYLRRRYRSVIGNKLQNQKDSLDLIGGSSAQLDVRKQLLQDRESRILRDLDEIRQNRHLRKKVRLRKEIPTVAVVGYTNAGKTSLIKALTGDPTLRPRDRLFATLDVTSYASRLPCGLQVLYLDTVGFVQDMPTALVASFTATLDDIADADLVLHVRDVSHPDLVGHDVTVRETLATLQLPSRLEESVINVDNKADLLDDDGDSPEISPVTSSQPSLDNKADLLPDDRDSPEVSPVTSSQPSLAVSALDGRGLAELVCAVEDAVLRNTGRKLRRFRISQGSDVLNYLHKEASVSKVLSDEENPENLIVQVIMTDASYARFKAFLQRYAQEARL